MPKTVKVNLVELLSLYASGLSAKAVAEQLGVSKPTVLRHLQKAGVERRSRLKVTKEVEGLIQALADRGVGTAEAAETLGLDRSTVLEHAKRLGVVFQDNYHVGFITTWNGYRMLPAPDHPRADSKGYVREHVLVAEKMLGRYLDEHEVVHHKDGDKTNNTPENLEVMTLSEHASLHAQAGDTGWGCPANRKR